MNSSPYHRGPPGRSGIAQPKRPTISGKTVGSGGKGKGSRGMGQGGKLKFGQPRHRKVVKDNILGVTKGDIRRMARRGGVKRISAGIYDEVRAVLLIKLTEYLKDCCAIADHLQRQTVTVSDVIFVLRRHGRPIWGFDDVVKSARTQLSGI